MKKKICTTFFISVGLLILFILYTIALTRVDLRPIGPENSLVGFATINQGVHNFFGINMRLYQITDLLSPVVFLFALGFVLLGLILLVKRKSILKVDNSILALGGFYAMVMMAYLFFEVVSINYRPILIEGVLEASYPSSTTMLAMCVLPTAMMQFYRRISHTIIRNCTMILCGLFMAFMVIGRLLSGAHWFTDIVGGMLLSSALVMLYYSLNAFWNWKRNPQIAL